ncbi:MAG: 30S ribosomal protein S2 [bacterium]|nr:30S ribosomal protein S2 [Deltaproteobacteria bacterium]MCP4906712.1 30S ribosomal protein S2 [bacterium]
MSETPATPEAEPIPAAAADAAVAPAAPATPSSKESELGEALKEQEISIRSLIEAGCHYGHQPSRWNPLMRSFIFGERNGTHIIDLDQTLPMFREALDFLRETTAAGGAVLFVGTKRQAQGSIMLEAKRAGQHYVNNRWLGGMLTNWKTVKKSIDRYNQYLEILGNEEKCAELSKKEQASMSRQVEKYAKSLEGIRAMQRPPDAVFVIDVGKESIAVQEAKRLHIPIVGVVDSNCNPRGIDFVVPGNDDALRAIDLYCTAIANACREGYAQHQAELVSQRKDESTPPKADGGPATGRRVVEIKQQPRRGRGQGGSPAGGGKAYSAGGAKGDDAPERAAASVPVTPIPAPAPSAPAEGEDK